MANSILDLFASSPIRPMQDHMAKVHECASELKNFFKATIDGNWEQADQLKTRIRELENEADDLKARFAHALAKRPFPAGSSYRPSRPSE